MMTVATMPETVIISRLQTTRGPGARLAMRIVLNERGKSSSQGLITKSASEAIGQPSYVRVSLTGSVLCIAPSTAGDVHAWKLSRSATGQARFTATLLAQAAKIQPPAIYALELRDGALYADLDKPL